MDKDPMRDEISWIYERFSAIEYEKKIIELKLSQLRKEIAEIHDILAIYNIKQIDSDAKEAKTMAFKHEIELIKQEAKNEQKSSFYLWLGRNWMSIIAFLGIIINIGYQLKISKP